jgi:hypothetical protein
MVMILLLKSDYKSEHYAMELGHSSRTGKKHKLVGSLSLRDAVYVVMSDVDLEHGFHVLVKTLLGP